MLKIRKGKLDKEKFWRGHIVKCEKSGLSKKEYCHKNRLNTRTMQSWQKKLFNNNMTRVPLENIPSVSSEQSTLEIVINNNLRISISENFNSVTLKKLLKTLDIKC